MSSAKTVAQAQRGIAKAVKAAGKDEALRELIAQTMSRADMAGRQMVDLYEMGPRQLSLDVGTAQDPRTFLNLPWDEALAAFRTRPRGATELSTLLNGNAKAAGVSHQLLLEGIQKRVNEMLAESIDQGGTFPEFAELIAAEADGLGITNQSPAYLENVFRTNVLGAYGQGRHEAMSDPDVISARPFRQWRTSLDNRVREEHAAFESQVWRADDPAMSGLKTPAGYQCRCSIVSLAKWDGELATSVPPGLVTPGFE